MALPSDASLPPDGTLKPHVAIAVDRLSVALPLGRGLQRLWSKRIWAFRNVTLNIRESETLAVLGRNGSGKTTFLQVLAGILEPDEGRIVSKPGLKTQILSPGAGFMKHLTGRENVYNSGIMQGFSAAQIKDSWEQIVDFAEMWDWIDQPVATYSTGMRARLGFALSVFLPSDILLIDETLSAGDPPFRDKARGEIVKLVNSHRTVIVVSHGLRFLSEIANRGMILDRGRLHYVGKANKAIDTYREMINSRSGDDD